MRTRTVLISLTLTALPLMALGQDGASGAASPTLTDAKIVEAFAAIERADGYSDLVAAAERHASAIGSLRTLELIDARLAVPSLDAAQRGLLILERQLSADSRRLGTTAAVRLLSIRLIAGLALRADSPKQFAGVLEKFSPLASTITPQLVREALESPGNSWPDGLLPLMEQLARDWPAGGALAAATRMAEGAGGSQPQSPAPVPAPDRGQTLAGHWRSTRVLFDEPQDEHLVLRPDGTAETWKVTADNRTPVTRGRWRNQGSNLSVDWEDGRQWGQPFTFYQGELVFPNVQNQRQFWELVE